VGDKLVSYSAGRPSTALVETERRNLGPGMLLGVLGLCRGVFVEVVASFCEGVCGRDGDRNIGKGGGAWRCEGVVDDVVIGDQGLDEAIDALEKLLRYVVGES
jgi:hypothetical protein